MSWRAYNLHECINGWTVAAYPTIGAMLVDIARPNRTITLRVGPDKYEVRLFSGSGGRAYEVVDPDAYSVQVPASHEEAAKFVWERAAWIADAQNGDGDIGFARAAGAFRCNPDDPAEKQLADYVASAPRQWRKA